MSKSYLKVNYLLRTRKQIERRLIIDVLQHLNPVLNIKDYHYFGLGSVYFADFILFHKYLSIKNMTSVDIEKPDETRFKFNKPYDFITFEIYDCNKYLKEKLNWADKNFIWLDYDIGINKDIVDTLEFIGAKSKPEDIFLITIEGAPLGDNDISNFKEDFKKYIPKKIKNDKHFKEDLPNRLFEVCMNAIKEGLKCRTDSLKFFPIFNIFYKDTKKMYTLGGFFGKQNLFNRLKKKLPNSPYLNNKRPIELNCPLLTPKEKTLLDFCIKKDGSIDVNLAKTCGLDEEEIKEYLKTYKYYPQFFESVY